METVVVLERAQSMCEVQEYDRVIDNVTVKRKRTVVDDEEDMRSTRRVARAISDDLMAIIN